MKHLIFDFTEPAVRDRVGTIRCRPSHTAHTESHGLKSRDRHQNLAWMQASARETFFPGRWNRWTLADISVLIFRSTSDLAIYYSSTSGAVLKGHWLKLATSKVPH